jgi:UDP-N-acetylmuramate: L-alanyl-gamma-D-glutamyl-meso-diaminopimelate ligase
LISFAKNTEGLQQITDNYKNMKIHLIAIGGAAMHNLALALHQNGHQVTGSDDEIYNPALSRLEKSGLLPAAFGWFTEKITADIDVIILGMHARIDNPELLRAQELGLKIYSYPEFIYQHAKDKKRVVVAGSHGKTSTTSMIMHVLKFYNRDFDYLVGAMLDGFDTMVRLSDAPVMVIEGDEYLASPIDRVPKIHHYKPDVAIITGIAWDHINVFPTYENYVEQFEIFIKTINTEGVLFYYGKDNDLVNISKKATCRTQAYISPDMTMFRGKLMPYKIKDIDGKEVYFGHTKLSVFGEHNLANLNAAYLACREMGVTTEDFFKAIGSFKGAAKRLQTLHKTKTSIAYLDFAHAPSKVKATVKAVSAEFPKRQLLACLELHTFSSLNKTFLPQYAETMNAADEAIVFFNEHTLAMKKMPPLSIEEVKAYFQHKNLRVFRDNQAFKTYLEQKKFDNLNLLLMTSGTFVGLDLKKMAKDLLNS